MSETDAKLYHPEVEEILVNQSENAAVSDLAKIIDNMKNWNESGEEFDREESEEEDDDDGQFDDHDNEDDDEDSSTSYEGGNVALAYDVNQLSVGDGLPQNGHDFLKLVQEEREKCPAITFAKPPTASTARTKVTSQEEPQTQSVSTPKSKSSPQSVAESNPDLKYRDQILNDFRKLREKIEDLRNSLFCSNEGMPATRSTKLKLYKLMELGQCPNLSSIIYRTQLELHQTLEFLADQCSLSPTMHLDWIYSIMAALREPIEPDICSTLRRLARICIARRVCLENNREKEKEKVEVVAATSAAKATTEEEEEEEEEYRSCLLVICIVRHYFGQADLK